MSVSAASVQIHCLSPWDRFLASLHPVGIDLGSNFEYCFACRWGSQFELGVHGGALCASATLRTDETMLSPISRGMLLG